MNFAQPKVASLPPNLDLHGKSAVVTGATAGIGLETARQLLKLHVSHLVIAVRRVSKGEACKRELQRLDTHAKITVLELDMDNYQSVQRFARALKLKVPSVNILLLNAGIGLLKLERSPSGHDRITQVNYLSNSFLIAELLPYLKTSAEQIGQSTRITWVGSRMFFTTSLERKAPMKVGESVLEHMDSKQFFFPNERYNDSKLLCAMFMYSLAARLDKSKVVLNMMSYRFICGWSMVMGVVKALLARPVEIGGRLFVNASVVAGPESNGGFLGDMEIIEPSPYLLSPAGKAVQRKLWAETIEELGNLTRLPAEFSLKESEQLFDCSQLRLPRSNFEIDKGKPIGECL